MPVVRNPKPNPYRFQPLPPDFNPLDATIDEVASYRRESRWTVFQKLKDGRYESYLDGRIRKIIFQSVKADRERSLAASRGSTEEPLPVKRKPGRPPNPRPETATASAG